MCRRWIISYRRTRVLERRSASVSSQQPRHRCPDNCWKIWINYATRPALTASDKAIIRAPALALSSSPKTKMRATGSAKSATYQATSRMYPNLMVYDGRTGDGWSRLQKVKCGRPGSAGLLVVWKMLLMLVQAVSYCWGIAGAIVVPIVGAGIGSSHRDTCWFWRDEAHKEKIQHPQARHRCTNC